MFKKLAQIARRFREDLINKKDLSGLWLVCGMDAYYCTHRRGAVLALKVWFFLAQALKVSRCCIVGHELVDLDAGSPEVGPDPDIVCTRCGRSY